MKKEGRKPLPKWVPKRFKDLVANTPYKNYKSIMMRIEAAEQRDLLLSLGEIIVERIRKGDVITEDKINEVLKRLVKCWPDPIPHEKEIFKIQKEIAKNYKITSYTKGGKEK